MSVLLHLSDTHFGTEQAPVVEALVALAQRERPTLAVLSGDVTQRARPAQFRAAKAFVDRLGAPCLTIPGNHDLPLGNLAVRLVAPLHAMRAVFGADLAPVIDLPDLFIVGIDTTRRWRHQNGAVSAAQAERAAGLVSAAAAVAPARLCVVVVHQPAAVLRAEDVHDRLRGHAGALRRWAEAGVDLVLGGHIHLPYTVLPAGLARPLRVVQAGTAVSSRVRAGVPNSVNIIRSGAVAPPGTCTIEQWDYAAAAGAFVRGSVTPHLLLRGSVTPHLLLRGSVTPHQLLRGSGTPQVPLRDSVTPAVLRRGSVAPQALADGL